MKMTGIAGWEIVYCYSYIKLILLLLAGANGFIPEASQEGILRRFRSYADLAIFNYNVPSEVSQATWKFAAFADSPSCKNKDVQIYIQHGSYPIIKLNNSSFPPNAYIRRTSLHHISTVASFKPTNTTIVGISNPLPGNWFAVAYVSNWDNQLKQEGLVHKCHYSLGSVAFWSHAPVVPVINIGTVKELFTSETFSYYKFFIPVGTWRFTVNVTNCQFKISSARSEKLNKTRPVCIKYISLRERALPFRGDIGNVTEGGGHIFYISEPVTECYYYLLIISDAKVSFNIEVSTEECHLNTVEGNNMKLLEHINGFLNVNFLHHHDNQFQANITSYLFNPNKSELRKLQKLDGLQNGDKCLRVFQLSRVKQTEDFSSTFLLQERGSFTHWMAISDLYPFVIGLEVYPYIDIGGTLSIGIHMDEKVINATKQLYVVTACIRKESIPVYIFGNITCSPDLQLTVSSKSLDSIDSTKLIPYPEPDKWYIAFQLKCYFNGSMMPCALREILLSFDIQINRCAFPINSCGSKGVCQENHKGVYFLTACYCVGGHSGWGCTDDSGALPQNILMLNTLLLTLSNIFFLPAAVMALRKSMVSEAVVYFATMGFSTLYHACDEDFYSYCVTKYEVLQFSDFFCSILAFWMTLIALAEIPAHLKSAFQIIGVIIIAVGVEYNRTGLLVFLIPSALGVSVPLLYWCLRSYKKSQILFKRSTFLHILPGMFLAGTGLIMFAFVETEANYQYVHSAWHVTIALSLLFLLPQSPRKRRGNPSSPPEVEFEDADNCSSSNQMFVFTSDVDNLLNA